MYLARMYGTQVSPDFIDNVTEEVMAKVTVDGAGVGAAVSSGVLRALW